MITKADRLPARVTFNWGRMLPWIMAALIFLLIAGPLGTMLVSTILPGKALSGEPLSFTTVHYEQAFGNFSTYRILLNTLLYATGTIAIGLTLALTLAWLMERTDMPGRNALYSLMFVPMAIPPFATASGWILLLGPNAGAINVWLRALLGIDGFRGPLNIYTLWGMMFVTGIAVVPSMWLLLLGLFRNMDPSLEEAGVASGMGRISVLRRVTLPLMRPGIMGVVVYYAIVAIEIFEIPLAIGLTAGVTVLSTKIFLLSATGGSEVPNYGIGATFGLMTMGIALIMVLVYTRALRQSARFAVVSGKGLRPRRIRLGRLKWVALAGVAAYFILQVVLPFLILLWSSFLSFQKVPSIDALGDLTLEKYRLFFELTNLGAVVRNTAFLMTGTATITILIAAIVAWLVVRRPSRITRALNLMSFIPLAIPGTVVAIGFLLLYLRTPLYGTVAVLVLAMTARFLAFTTRLLIAAQIQIDKSLEEVATASGVGKTTTFFRINLPLMAPSLLNGWLWVAVHSLRDFTIPLFLATFTSPVIANTIFEQFIMQGPQGAAVPIVLLVATLVMFTFVTRRWFQTGWAK
jgi:iron(III) transport system permease protein